MLFWERYNLGRDDYKVQEYINLVGPSYIARNWEEVLMLKVKEDG